MIYRILHDDEFMMHVIPPVEAMKKLGPQGVIAMDASPRRYLQTWKVLDIEFAECSKRSKAKLPDISENFGRLYLSQKAQTVLADLLKECGECLPVNYQGEPGFIFNPLLTAEALNALDEKLLSYDAHGNLVHFGFIEAQLAGVPVFKTQIDTYKGIFCSEAFKKACERAGLRGVIFSQDLANPIGTVGASVPH